MRDAVEIVGGFSRLHVLVLGDAMLDSYLLGRSTRLSREAPAPIVDITSRVDAGGGAANTAANVSALGGNVSFLTVLGQDEDGDRLLRCLARDGVRTDQAIRSRDRGTLVKQRIVAEPQLIVRFDQGTTQMVDGETEAELIARLRRLFLASDAVIVSDYGYGVLTPAVVAALAELQRCAPRTVVVDAKDLPKYREVAPTIVKPNFDEALMLLGVSRPLPDDRSQFVVGHAPTLFKRTGAENVAVTLDADGALLLEPDGSWYRTYAEPAPHARAAGAGDTFVATLALVLASGGTATEAAELASAASGVVVKRDGTTTCEADDLCAALAGDGKIIHGEDALRAVVNAYRHSGRRVVLTSGCFDIVHRGHVTYLSQAKALGDVLIVALNSDESVRRLKGAERPVNTFEDRARVLEGLSCVDHVLEFAEDTPEGVIRLIGPDVFAKGGDYTRETLPETPLVEALGGAVSILPYIDGASTTRVIEQIRSLEELRGTA
ncbi:MAG: D-glycero-beta-D-manno-heptose 1-phosphate adenylyltransferase [Dehalococcoidia bacterium]